MFTKKGRYTQKDFQAAAHESERKYQEGGSSRWYNNEKLGPLFPYLTISALGLLILSGIFATIANRLSSMTPRIEVLTELKITKKEYDDKIPSFMIVGEKDGKELKLKNRNSALERKVNESDIQKYLLEGQTYDLEVSRRGDDPIDVYGNILEIKREYK